MPSPLLANLSAEPSLSEPIDVQRLQTGARTAFQHPFTRPRTEHRVQIGQPQEGQLQIQQATL